MLSLSLMQNFTLPEMSLNIHSLATSDLRNRFSKFKNIKDLNFSKILSILSNDEV